jgi:hypothetical protein
MADRSAFGRYCCKSPKLPGANFLAVKKSDRRPVCAENSDSDISVMKSPDQRMRHNASDPLNSARDRCVLV